MSSLTGTDAADAVFTSLLDKELAKIVLFYENQRQELFTDFAELENLVAQQDAAGLSAGRNYMDLDEDDDEDDDEYEDEDYDDRCAHDEAGVRSHANGEHVLFAPDAVRRARKTSSVSHRPRSAPRTVRGPSLRRYSLSSSDGGVGDPATLPRRRRASSSAAAGKSRSPVDRMRDLASIVRGVWDGSSALDDDSSVWTSKSNYAWDVRLLFKRRITTLYVSFSSLRSYVELNHSGFRKILKK